MSDEAFVPKAPKQPPDFTADGSKWKLVEKLSAHMYITNPRSMMDYPCKDLDPQMPSWVGYVSVYEKDGIGIGREYNFFGKDIRLKYWGMKGEEYHDLAILMPDNKWQVVPFGEYEVESLAGFGQKTDAKKVLEVHLALYRKTPRTKLAGLHVKR